MDKTDVTFRRHGLLMVSVPLAAAALVPIRPSLALWAVLAVVIFMVAHVLLSRASWKGHRWMRRGGTSDALVLNRWIPILTPRRLERQLWNEGFGRSGFGDSDPAILALDPGYQRRPTPTPQIRRPRLRRTPTGRRPVRNSSRRFVRTSVSGVVRTAVTSGHGPPGRPRPASGDDDAPEPPRHLTPRRPLLAGGRP